MTAYALNIQLSKDFQFGTIARDQGRDSVTVKADELGLLFEELACDPTQATLQRWYTKKRQPEPRVVVTYDGAVIEDAGENIRVRFTAPPRNGVVTALRQAGFKDAELTDVFERRINPQTIFGVQDVLRQFYGSAA